MKRMYQYIKIPGKELRYEGKDRDKSKFWDIGKWNTFIEPLIPEDSLDLPFLEIGSNSGLFLKSAEDKGFRSVWGVESHPDRVTQSHWYKKSAGGSFTVIPQAMGASFDWNQVPRLGLTLISNTHYYMTINDFAEVVNALRNRTLYCIVVSCDGKVKSGRVSCYINDVRGYFKDWTEVGVIENVDMEGDPSPRAGMYGVIFKSNLEAVDLPDWWNGVQKWKEKLIKSKGTKCDYAVEAIDALDDFYKRLFSEEPFNPEKTLLFDYYCRRKGVGRAKAEIVQKEALGRDIKENGIKNLIYQRQDGSVLDGLTRSTIAHHLGYKRIIVKKF